MSDIKQSYAEWKKKHKELPGFDELDNEFEISNIEDSFILRGIRRRIVEKVEFYAKLVEDLLQPEANLTNMYECRDCDDKEEIYFLFKKLMFFSRFSAEVSLKCDENEDVRFLCEFFKAWNSLKPDLSSTTS